MEKEPKQNLETEKEQLTSFRKEIQQIKDAEMAKKAEGRKDYNPHFETIDPQELGEREYEAYRSYKNGALKVDHFCELREKTNEAHQDKPIPRSIRMFWGFLGNEMASKR